MKVFRTQNAVDWKGVTDEVKHDVPLRQGFRLVDWRVRSRGRADCGLCKGYSTGTIAFTERLWRCHRCLRGGSIFDLIMLAHNCSFLDALKFLAAEARIDLPSDKKLSAEEWRRLQREREERERREAELDTGCAEIKQHERSLRTECVRQIHECDAVLTAPAPWDEHQWMRARAAHILREEFLLPEFTVLAFAAMNTRLGYVMNDARERAALLTAVRWAGGVTTDDDHFVEVVT